MYPVFAKGDKVVINSKAPKWIRGSLNPYVARTVVGIYYDRKGEYNLYFLGGKRGHGGTIDITSFGFRGYMLDHYVKFPQGHTYNRAQKKQADLQRQIRESITRTGKRPKFSL